jgi:hypothetical protein
MDSNAFGGRGTHGTHASFCLCRPFLNWAYSITFSRSSSSSSAVALRSAFARDFGCAWGKKIVMDTPKNWASLSKSEIAGL